MLPHAVIQTYDPARLFFRFRFFSTVKENTTDNVTSLSPSLENMYHLRPSTRWFRCMIGSSAASLAHSRMLKLSPRLRNSNFHFTGTGLTHQMECFTFRWDSIHVILDLTSHRSSCLARSFGTTCKHMSLTTVRTEIYQWLSIYFHAIFNPGQKESWLLCACKHNLFVLTDNLHIIH